MICDVKLRCTSIVHIHVPYNTGTILYNKLKCIHSLFLFLPLFLFLLQKRYALMVICVPTYSWLWWVRLPTYSKRDSILVPNAKKINKLKINIFRSAPSLKWNILHGIFKRTSVESKLYTYISCCSCAPQQTLMSLHSRAEILGDSLLIVHG